jgi:hypothetical protein
MMYIKGDLITCYHILKPIEENIYLMMLEYDLTMRLVNTLAQGYQS